MISLIIALLMIQPSYPPLPSPTPWASPTPVVDDMEMIDDANELLATIEPTQFAFEVNEDTNDVTFNGTDVLNDIQNADSVLLFGYIKWMVTAGIESVLGPFAPLMIAVGVLVALGFISLLVYFWENVIVTIIKIVFWTVSQILRLFGR